MFVDEEGKQKDRECGFIVFAVLMRVCGTLTHVHVPTRARGGSGSK